MVVCVSTVHRISVCADKKIKARLVLPEMVDKLKTVVGVAKTPALDWATGAYGIGNSDIGGCNNWIPEICVSWDCHAKPLANCFRIASGNWSDGLSDSTTVSFPAKGMRNVRKDTDLARPIRSCNQNRIIEMRDIDGTRKWTISNSIRLPFKIQKPIQNGGAIGRLRLVQIG